MIEMSLTGIGGNVGRGKLKKVKNIWLFICWRQWVELDDELKTWRTMIELKSNAEI